MLNFLDYLFNQNIHLLIPNISQLNSFFGILVFIFSNIIVGHTFLKNNTLLGVSFFCGYSILYFITLFSYVFFKINVLKIYYFYLFFSICLIFLNKKNLNSFFQSSLTLIKKNFYIILILIPQFILIFNSNAIGWDVFSHWLPLANALKDSSEFLLRGHASNYPFANSLVLVNSSIFLNSIGENISAIFSFFQILILIELFIMILKNYLPERIIQRNKILIICFLFLLPIHMNKFVYTSYVDFDLSVILIFYSLILFSNLKLEKKNIILMFLGVLLVGVKNTGAVIFAFIIFSYTLVNYQYCVKNFKIFIINLFPILFVPFVAWLIWQYQLYSSENLEKFIVYDYLRNDILKNFFNSVFFQINERKFFYYFSFLVFSFSILNLILNFKSFNEFFKLINFYSIIFSLWFVFLIIVFVFHFNSSILDNATSFWRYNFHISLILTFIFITIFIYFLEEYFSQSTKFVNFFCIILLLSIPILYAYKFRRDLYPTHLEIIKFEQFKNKFNKVLLISDDSGYHSIRLNYYLDQDYRKSIVDFMLIKDFDQKKMNKEYFKNEGYELVIILEENEKLILKKLIYIF